MSESRLYTRELNDTERKWLKTYYEQHLHRKGFLTAKQKKRLLGLKRRERGTPDSDFWYKLKHRVQNVVVDLKLICDVASERQLQEMFGEKIRMHEKTLDVYPMALVLISLLPSMLSADILKENVSQTRKSLESARIDLERNRNRPDEVKRLEEWIKASELSLKQQEKELQPQLDKLKEQEWRKYILEDVAVNVLQWYLASGIFQTDSHRRMIIDTLDAISIMSSGKKMNLRHDPDQLGMKSTLTYM
jgi:hypothetical protein